MPVCLENLLFLCSYVLMFSALAVRYGVSPYVSWVTRTSVRGQPRSGLLCVLCKLLLLMYSALSGPTQTLYLLFFCPFVLMFSALAARYGVSPYVSLATRTSVRGQPRSGLLCVLCKLLLLMFSALSG